MFSIFRDRFRTAVNVWGDSVGAGVVEALSTSQLKKLDYGEQETAGDSDTQDGAKNGKVKDETMNGTANAAFTDEASQL